MFVKKDARFRPAGGETSFSRSDRVTPVILHKLRGGRSTPTFDQMGAGFACGSMVLLFLFYKKIHNMIFCEKEWFLPPCRRRKYLPGQ